MKGKIKWLFVICGTALFFYGYFFIHEFKIRMIVCGIGAVLACYFGYKLVSDAADKVAEKEEGSDTIDEMTDEELGDFLTQNGEYDEENEDEQFCSKCGDVRKPGCYFCTSCGNEFDKKIRICKNCSEEVESGEKYCHECGNELTENDIYEESEAINNDLPCPRCHHKYLEDWNYCSTCGFDLKEGFLSCPECGAAVKKDWAYCDICGANLQKKGEN